MSAESLIASLRTAQDSTLSLILLTRLLPDLPPDSLPSLKDAIIRQLPQPATNKNVIAHLVAELVRLPTHAGWPQLEHFLASTPTSLLTLAICTEAPQLAPNDPTPLLVHGTPSLKFLVAYLKFIPLPALANYSNCFPVLFNSLPTYLQPLDTDSLNDSFTTLIDLFDSTQRTTLILKTTTLHSNLTSFLLALLSPPATASSTPRLEDDTYQLILELLCSVVEYSEALSFDDPNFLPSFINVLLNLMARTEGYAGIDSTGTNPLEAENEEKEWLDKSDFSSGNEEEDQAIGFIAESVLDRIALVIGGKIFNPIIEKLSAVLLSPLPSTNPDPWRVHYSALSALATIAEGCATEIIENLPGVLSLILPSIGSSHPRLRFAAIYALGQLCTDTEGAIQEEFGAEVLGALLGIVSGGVGEYRKLKAYATSCLVNYFQYPSTLAPLTPSTTTPIYPQLFYTLLALLRDESHRDIPDPNPEKLTEKNDWVKGHALEAIGSFAGCPGEDFSPYYRELMPTLLGLLETDALETRVRGAVGGLSSGIRNRLVDCSASIAVVVPLTLFAQDSYRLCEALFRINAHNIALDQSSRTHSTEAEVEAAAELEVEKETTFSYLLSAFLRLAEAIPFIAPSTAEGGALSEEEKAAGRKSVEARERIIIPFLQTYALPILLSTAMASIVSEQEVARQTDPAEEEEDEDDVEATREESLVAVENLVMLVQSLHIPRESLTQDGPPRLSFEELLRVRVVAFATLADEDHLAIREAASALLAVGSESLQNEIPLEATARLFSETTIAISSHLHSDEVGEITSTLLASWVTIFTGLRSHDNSDETVGREMYLSPEALGGLIASFGIVLERVRGRKLVALAGSPAEEKEEEEEEELAWDDERYYDESILNAVYRAVHLLNLCYASAGAIEQIKDLTTFLGLLNIPSTASGVFRFSRRFALRLLGSVVLSYKEESHGIVSQYLPAIIQGLADTDVEIREYSSRAIIAIVDSPARSSYGSFISSSVQPLLASVREIDLDDERLLIARDISIAALGKIIEASSSNPSIVVDSNALLPAWLVTLPVMVSTDSFNIVVPLLLRLHNSAHPSLISPSLAPHHILKVLISHLDNPNVPSELQAGIVEAAKVSLRKMEPQEGKRLFESMPEEVQEILLA